MKTITLLCRGESLKLISVIPKVDHCVLVNAFHFELENDDIHNYVLASQAVTHVVSLGAKFSEMILRHVYKRYNFDKIVVPYIKECVPQHDFIRVQEIQGPNGEYLPVTCLGDINKNDMVPTKRYKFTAPSCGLDALLYIVNELKADVVNIIGMDFYDNVGYFTNSYGNKIGENDVESVMDRMKGSDHDANNMKSFFYNFIKKKPNTKFIIYTCANLDSTISNLDILKTT